LNKSGKYILGGGFMSIKPIDYQVILPKTSEVSKIKNDEANKNQMIQQQQQSSGQEKIDNRLKQVVNRENVQNGRVTEKQEKDSRRQNEKKKKRQNKDDRPTIDIRI
jgi:F0F1-type ATP synthase epsilon subunit